MKHALEGKITCRNVLHPNMNVFERVKKRHNQKYGLQLSCLFQRVLGVVFCVSNYLGIEDIGLAVSTEIRSLDLHATERPELNKVLVNDDRLDPRTGYHLYGALPHDSTPLFPELRPKTGANLSGFRVSHMTTGLYSKALVSVSVSGKISGPKKVQGPTWNHEFRSR